MWTLWVELYYSANYKFQKNLVRPSPYCFFEPRSNVTKCILSTHSYSVYVKAQKLGRIADSQQIWVLKHVQNRKYKRVPGVLIQTRSNLEFFSRLWRILSGT